MRDVNSLYKQVFTANGEVKAVGREKCKELIVACRELYKEKYLEDVNFGDEDTGFMDVDKIKQFIFSGFSKI